jgi:hypothetical protein
MSVMMRHEVVSGSAARTGGNRYLVLSLGAEPAADLAVPPGRDELIATMRGAGPSVTPRWLSGPSRKFVGGQVQAVGSLR